MNINEMSLTELKALAYDSARVLEQASNNLRVINQTIEQKTLSETQMDEQEVVATPEVAETPVEETAEVVAESATEEVAPEP